MTTHPQSAPQQFSFPTTMSLVEKHLKLVEEKTPEQLIEGYSTRLIKRQLMQAFEITKRADPIELFAFAKNPTGEYRVSKSNKELNHIIEHHRLLPNEFFVLFDIQKFQYHKVDEKIKNILGIDPQDFTLAAMAGLDPENNLYHRDDYLHVVRWACIAYMTISAPIFTWESNQDIYRVNFRAGTKKSQIQELRDIQYVCLEKNCIIICHEHKKNMIRPSYHFDKWTVLPFEYFRYVNPRFLSTPSREIAINGYLYLLNILLLNIPIKYVVMLQARHEGKNNAVATTLINSKIEKHSNNQYRFTEKQITDSIQKTIRLRIEQTFNQCDKREKSERVQCKTDQDAIELAHKMGILPIPPAIEQLIFRSCSEIDKTVQTKKK